MRHNSFAECVKQFQSAVELLGSKAISVYMSQKTWKILMSDKRMGERMPHLFRQFHPRRRTRTMRGK